jgi:nucleotide-binding universal stress UspA family protein
MRVVVAVDWSDETFNAVQELTKLYAPSEVALVHAADLGFLEYPAVAQAMNVQGYDEFRQGLLKAGRQLLDQTAALLPGSVAVKKLCEVGSPAQVILDTATAAKADLLVLGSRNRNRIAELALGSVSHRVLLHAPCSTLVIKRQIPAPSKVLLAVQGDDDARRLQQWLRSNPFVHPVDLTVLTVMPRPDLVDPPLLPLVAAWNEAVVKTAQDLLDRIVTGLQGPHYRTVEAHLVEGNPAESIAHESARHHLVIVGSHGRGGLERFLLGSVSHAVTHRVACPILVVR